MSARLIPLTVVDPAEEILPELGLLFLEDAEGRGILAIDSGSLSVRRGYARAQASRAQGRKADLQRDGVSPIVVRTDARDYAAPLVNYFRIRARRA